MSSQDVKLTSTDDLIAELKSRYEHIVIGAIRTAVKVPGDMVTVRNWKGDYTVCVGLCSQLEADINDANYKAEKDIRNP